MFVKMRKRSRFCNICNILCCLITPIFKGPKGDSMWKNRENMTHFCFGFLTKKVKSYWYFSNKNIFWQSFGSFWRPFKDFFFSFWCFLNEIVNLMSFFLLFQVKVSFIPSVTGQNPSKCLQFYVFNGYFCFVLHTIFFGNFHYFGPYGRSASEIFDPLLSFDHINPAIIWTNKKCALCVFRYG